MRGWEGRGLIKAPDDTAGRRDVENTEGVEEHSTHIDHTVIECDTTQAARVNRERIQYIYIYYVHVYIEKKESYRAKVQLRNITQCINRI